MVEETHRTREVSAARAGATSLIVIQSLAPRAQVLTVFDSWPYHNIGSPNSTDRGSEYFFFFFHISAK